MGGSEIISRLVDDLRDENESFRRVVMETIEKICSLLGVADVNSKLEEKLVEGV